MLIFCLGTAAELIKCHPVMLEASRKGLAWMLLSTGQSPKNLRMQFDDYGLEGQGAYVALLDTERDLDSPIQALIWFFRLLLISTARVRSLIARAGGRLEGACWIVHGDTLSTLGGAWLGRRMGLTVAHIEAGMRSGTWWSPFPEELDRRWVSKVARLHFASNPACEKALIEEKVSGKVVRTEGNTQLDAFTEISRKNQGQAVATSYAVANLHRFENLNHPERWNILIETVLKAQKKTQVLFVMHPQTEAKLEESPSAKQKLIEAGVTLLPRQPFVRFVGTLSGAKFLISDGGGNQDECLILGLPCLILRTHVESASGLAPSGPCLLSEMKQAKIDEFLADPEKFRRPPFQPARPPSTEIVEVLKSL